MTFEDIQTTPGSRASGLQSNSQPALGQSQKQVELDHLEKAVVDKNTQFVVSQEIHNSSLV